MSVYDIAMLIIMGGAIWFGFWKGLAWQVASVAAIVVSYIVAVNFRDPVSKFIQTDPPWNNLIAMLILFLGTSLVIWTIYAKISNSIKEMEMKGFDRQAGALLGAVKGALLCMVVTMFAVSLLGDSANLAINNSKFGPYVVKGITKVSSIVPQEVSARIQHYVDAFQKEIQNPPAGFTPEQNFPGSQYQADGAGSFGFGANAPASPAGFQQPTAPAQNQPFRGQAQLQDNWNTGSNWNTGTNWNTGNNWNAGSGQGAWGQPASQRPQQGSFNNTANASANQNWPANPPQNGFPQNGASNGFQNNQVPPSNGIAGEILDRFGFGRNPPPTNQQPPTNSPFGAESQEVIRQAKERLQNEVLKGAIEGGLEKADQWAKGQFGGGQ